MSDDRLHELTESVANLEASVRSLQDRVAALEGRPSDRYADAESPTLTAEAETTLPLEHDGFKRPSATRAFSLLGASILILAGAFLLRALTDSQTLPPLVGFILGLVYSLALIGVSHRAGAFDQARAAGFGLTAVVVAFPFLFETTAVLKLVSPVTGGALLTFVTTAGLLSAWSRRSRILAWAYTTAAWGTILALGIATDAAAFYAALLLVLGVATMLLAYSRRWHLKRWLVALTADVVIFRLTILVINPAGSGTAAEGLTAGAVLILALALLVIYVGVFTYRALVQGRGVKVFDIIQSLAALLVGYGGATRLAQNAGLDSGLLGWASVAAAVIYYAVAFTVVRQRHGRGRGFFYFATLALLFLFLGSREVAEGGWLAWSWIVLGLATSILGGVFDRVTLRAHSAIYLVVAGFQTGMFATVKDAFIGSATSSWRTLDVSAVVALVVTAGCYWILVFTQKTGVLTWTRRLPRLVVGVVCLLGFSSLAVSLLVKLLAGTSPGDPAAVVAVTRTGIMAIAALGLAFVGRRPHVLELGWIVYPILALGLVKLLAEDLRIGNPLALSLAFALFGTALILAPRLLRHRARDAAGTPPAD
jgi:hypothetical protein